MHTQKTISILGCGWLGLPLAQHLIRLSMLVKGSTTHPDKLSFLEQNNIIPYLIQFNPEINPGYQPEFFQCDVLVVNIPPGRRPDVVSFYTRQMQSLISLIIKSQLKKVLLISSTSVYPDINREVTEEDAGTPDKSSGEALLWAEEAFRQHAHFSTTILRFCGLYGPDRNPGRFLAGKTLSAMGNAGVNLIHQEDCIQIISRILRQEIWGEVLNACADQHPAKKDFYPLAAQSAGLPAPIFEGREEEKFKIISSKKLKEKLNYTFLHPDPMQSINF